MRLSLLCYSISCSVFESFQKSSRAIVFKPCRTSEIFFQFFLGMLLHNSKREVLTSILMRLSLLWYSISCSVFESFQKSSRANVFKNCWTIRIYFQFFLWMLLQFSKRKVLTSDLMRLSQLYYSISCLVFESFQKSSLAIVFKLCWTSEIFFQFFLEMLLKFPRERFWLRI